MALLEKVRPCWRKCVTVVGFEVSDGEGMPSGSFPFPADPDVEFSAPLQHHVSLHAAMIPTMLIMN